jgi:hypothetical protein
MIGASDLVSDVEVPILCLHGPSLWKPSAHAVAASFADSGYEIPIPRIPPGDEEALLPHPVLSYPSYPSHPLSLPSPCPQACECG